MRSIRCLLYSLAPNSIYTLFIKAFNVLLFTNQAKIQRLQQIEQKTNQER